ncbi:autotransporter domain-containing protein [Roseinatronobacter alkalisoli]|uniref:Autotransporter domain-containing protein n=1 Tax=Roseinatronobacter alkalisoli TaxID=3028235 RepID=A0ABT5TDR4_9RHOB|nr:autotransporter domain-containing protein [Roseinatronobacter sp. HJB301]MDD7972033.1 autotransporter domain-containing protein [Roseinatronobacter sp. HJB301]
MKTGIGPQGFVRAWGHKWRRAVLAGSTALTFAASPALAQSVSSIDNDAHEIVDGTGTGTQPSSWEIGGPLFVGETGVGALTIENGGRVSNTWGVIGRYSGSMGDVIVSGMDADGNASTWSNSGTLVVGDTGVGALTIENGGRVSNTSGVIGRNPGWVGDVIVSGMDADGNASTWSNSGTLFVGDGGTATLTISDGGVVTSGATYLGVDRADASGAIALNSNGVLATGFIEQGLGSGTVSFDGGILRATEDQADYLRNFSSGDVTISAGGLTFDTDGFDTGIATGLQGSGGLTLTGDGRLTLRGVNSYTGNTHVAGGILIVDGTIASSALLTVSSGAMLGGSGTVGTVAVADGGILAPGNSVGTLTVDGDLSLSSGSILEYEIGSPGTAPDLGTSDRIDVTGDLALNSTLNLSQSDDATDGTAGFGYYRLMTYGGDLSGDGLQIGTTPVLTGPVSYEVLTGNGNVDLFIGTLGDDTLQHWQGGDGTWNAANTRWLNQGGDVSLVWAGNHAVFRNEPGGFAGGTITVEGAQNFKGLQFVDEGYRLEGDGALQTDMDGSEIRVLADNAEIATEITGTGGITKTQAGTLVLSGQNTYQGGTTILEGAVQVSEDANLGAASGGLILDGGTLATVADMDSARSVELAGTGAFDVAANTTLHLTGVTGGAGDLLMLGDGTLVLTGANTYEGDTLVSAGTLIGDATAIRGNIGNAGTMVFDQTGTASFVGNIGGLGSANGQMEMQGGGTLMLEGISTLDWTVRSGGLVSAAGRFAGDVEIGANGTFTFDQADDANYAGVLSGAGGIIKDGDGFVLLSGDSSAFAGTTTITRGTLLVGDADGNGALGGSLDVLGGATLGGSGTIGAGTGSLVTVASGGTLSPGNSIGTLTVNGDLIFAAGSRFEVEVNPDGTDSDLIAVTGDAILNGGSVAHIGASGEYDLRSSYTILSADGTLTGTFDNVSTDFAFLNPDLTYDYGARTVNLALVRNDIDFASAALTRNQIATADGIESIGINAGHAVYDAIARLADDEELIRTSFDQLSGEIHASARTILIEDSRFVRDVVNARLRAAFAAPGASRMPALAYHAGGTPMQVSADHAGPVFWTHGAGTRGSAEGNGNAAGFDRSGGGFLLGSDVLVGNWRLGLAAGYSRTRFNIDDRASSGLSKNYHLGIYGGGAWDSVRFSGGLFYTRHSVEIERTAAFAGFADGLSSGYNARSLMAFGELGYRIETARAAFEPFLGFAHINLRSGGFAEDGGAAALSAGSQRTTTSFATLGVNAATELDLGGTRARLRGTLGWRRAFGDTTPLATHGFAGSDPFGVAGIPVARNAAVIEAGLALGLSRNSTLDLAYSGQIARGVREHSLRLSLAMQF